MDVLDKSSRQKCSEDFSTPENGRAWVPRVNGKHSKHMQNGESLSLENGVAKMMQAHIPTYKEVLHSLESWQGSKVAAWHSLEGHSVQWFSVVCMDRRGMMAEVTMALAAVGITICSCVAEIDKGRGMAVMLFHVEGDLDALVKAWSSVDLILGILRWSTGCSWPSSMENPQLYRR